MKKWFIVAAALILTGCILFAGAMHMLGWNFLKLSNTRFEINNYVLSGDVTDISILVKDADVTFVPGDCISVTCNEYAKVKHQVSIKDGILSVEAVDLRKWYDFIGINIANAKITVTLPAGLYGNFTVRSSTGDVAVPKDYSFSSMDIAVSTGNVEIYASAGDMKLGASTGDLKLENITAENLDLRVSTGHIRLTDVACRNLSTLSSTGKVKLANVVAQEAFTIQSGTGDVSFDRCDAASLLVTTSTGDVTGSLRTDKVFVAHANTGKITVPETVTGGKCEIRTGTGDIKIKIVP